LLHAAAADDDDVAVSPPLPLVVILIMMPIYMLAPPHPLLLPDALCMYVCNLNGKVRKDELRHALYCPSPSVTAVLLLLNGDLAGTAYSRRCDGGLW